MKPSDLFSNSESSKESQDDVQSPVRRFLFAPHNVRSLPNLRDLSLSESSSPRFERARSVVNLSEAEILYRLNISDPSVEIVTRREMSNPVNTPSRVAHFRLVSSDPLVEIVSRQEIPLPVNTPGRLAPLRAASSYFDLSPLTSPNQDPLLPPVADGFQLPEQSTVEPRLYSVSLSSDSNRGNFEPEQSTVEPRLYSISLSSDSPRGNFEPEESNVLQREYSSVSEPSIHSRDSTYIDRSSFSEPPITYQSDSLIDYPRAEGIIDPTNINSPRQINRVRREQTPFVAGLEFLSSAQEDSLFFDEEVVSSSLNSRASSPILPSESVQSQSESVVPRAFSIDASPSVNARFFFISSPPLSPQRHPSSIVGSPIALNLDRNIARGNPSSEK